GAASHFAGSLLLRPLDIQINAYYEPEKLATGYREWRDRPILHPAISEGMDLFNRGLIDADDLEWICTRQGANLRQNPGGGSEYYAWLNDLWRKVAVARREIVSLAEVQEAAIRGFIRPENVDAWLRRCGGHIEISNQTREWRVARPGVSEVMEAYARDRINGLEFSQLLKEAG